MNNLTRFVIVLGLIVAACKGGSDSSPTPSPSAATSSAAAPANKAPAVQASKANTPPAPDPVAPAGKPADVAKKAVRKATATKKTAAKAELIAIRNALLFDNVLLGGHPTPNQVRAAANAGYKTIINLQMDSERGVSEERALAKELGLTYVSIPVAGAAGMTEANARALDSALAKAKTRGPTMFHCASGNRVGGLYALRAFYVDKKSPADALAFGKKRGLRSLEPKVRSVLGL